MEFVGIEYVVVAAVVVLERVAATERQPKVGLRRGEFDLVNGERSGSAAEEYDVGARGTVVCTGIGKARTTDGGILTGERDALGTGARRIPILILIGVRIGRRYGRVADGRMEDGLRRNDRTLCHRHFLRLQVAVGVVDGERQLGALPLGGRRHADLNGRIAVAARGLDSHPFGGFFVHGDAPGTVGLDSKAAVALFGRTVLIESQRCGGDFQIRSGSVVVVIDTAHESRRNDHHEHAEQQLQIITLSHSI